MIHPHPTPIAGNRFHHAQIDHSPVVVFWETTKACDLVCKHCRACAQTSAHPNELNTQQGKKLLADLARFPHKPIIVMTGGDPLKRKDLFELIEEAQDLRLLPSLAPSVTPLLDRGALDRLHRASIHRLAVSLDGPDAASHDGFRGVKGVFDQTIDTLKYAAEIGLPTQINTTITPDNWTQVRAIGELVAQLDVTLWSVFFLVPTGRAIKQKRIQPHEFKAVFQVLHELGETYPLAIKTTEAPFYRRYQIERGRMPMSAPGRPIAGLNDGKGILFISHTGVIQPSGFLPIRCGRFPEDSIVDVYQNHSLFQNLRQPDCFQGPCGQCTFRDPCGGSRARAYAVEGSPLMADPDCFYQQRHQTILDSTHAIN